MLPYCLGLNVLILLLLSEGIDRKHSINGRKPTESCNKFKNVQLAGRQLHGFKLESHELCHTKGKRDGEG